MAFPTVGQRLAQGFLASTTDHQVTMPGSVAARRLLVIVFNSGTAQVTTPDGWTAMNPAGGYNISSTRRAYVFAKVTDGSEGGTTVNCVTDAAFVASSVVYYFSDEGYQVAQCLAASAAAATGTSTTPNPPSLTSGFGAVDTLWIAVTNAGAQISAYPASYSNGQTTAGFGLGTAERQVNGASQDPGTFTIASSATWDAFTLAVRAPDFPAISAADVESFESGDSIVITGTNFKSSQGAGGVELGDNPDHAAATLVGQTETSWGDTSITITTAKGGLGYGLLYLFVTNSSGFVSNPWPVTLIEAEPALLDPSDPAAELEVILYDGSGNQAGAIIELVEEKITDVLRGMSVASFVAPYSAAGVSLATIGREIAIRRIGEGELFRGTIQRRGRPVDIDGTTVVRFACCDLLLTEVLRRQTWRSELLLDATAQNGIDQLLDDADWTGTITGTFSNLTKDFVNQGRMQAIDDFATAHRAYWRRTAARTVEVKNYHSPSGIVLTNPENAALPGRLGLIESIDTLDEDGASVVNRIAVEIKTDGSRLVTLQDASVSAPYPIQSTVPRVPRVIDAEGKIGDPEVVVTSLRTLGENRFALVFFTAAGVSGSNHPAAQLGGQAMTPRLVNSTGGGAYHYTYSVAHPPKGTPLIAFPNSDLSTFTGVEGVTLEGVDPVAPLYGSLLATGTGTAVSMTIPSEEGTLVVAFVRIYDDVTPKTISADNAEVFLTELDDAFAAGWETDGITAWSAPGEATSTTMSWTLNTSYSWEVQGFVLRPAKTYYIEDEASQADYGVSELVLSLPSFPEVEIDRAAGANAAYYAAVYKLERSKEPPTTLAVKVSYLPGTPLDWHVGDTLRFLPRTTAVNTDERWICVERTHSYDADGVRRWELTLSNKAQVPDDEMTFLARLVGGLAATQANQV